MRNAKIRQLVDNQDSIIHCIQVNRNIGMNIQDKRQVTQVNNNN